MRTQVKEGAAHSRAAAEEASRQPLKMRRDRTRVMGFGHLLTYLLRRCEGKGKAKSDKPGGAATALKHAAGFREYSPLSQAIPAA